MFTGVEFTGATTRGVMAVVLTECIVAVPDELIPTTRAMMYFPASGSVRIRVGLVAPLISVHPLDKVTEAFLTVVSHRNH
jgi:hypothetical protein